MMNTQLGRIKMKTSSKILLSVLAALLIFTIGGLISLRILVDRAAESGGGLRAISEQDLGDKITQQYDLDEFSRVKVTGGWSVSISASEEYKVSISFPENLQDHVKVTKSGQALILETTGLVDFKGSHFKAEIQMPELSALSSEGGLTATLSNFSGDELLIESGGGVQLNAADCAYNQLELELSGGIQGNLKELKADNIHIEGNGAVDLDLYIDGGSLTGEVNGAAHIRIRGSLKKNTLKVNGVSNIEYLN